MKTYKILVLLLAGSFVSLHADEIHELVKNKNLVEIKKLVKENPKAVHSIDENGRTALHYAAQQDHLDVTELLLSFGADVNATDLLSRTPMYWASIRVKRDGVCQEVVELLRSHNGRY